MNNKGFMMAEVIVVSAIVFTVLTTVYISYNKLYMLYTSRLDYYDAVCIYRLGYYRDILIENKEINNKLNEAKNNSNKIIEISKLDNSDKVFLIYNNMTKLANDTINWVDSQNSVNRTFKDYLHYLSTSDVLETNKSNYVLVMERCSSSNDCKYAYLEVYDGYE